MQVLKKNWKRIMAAALAVLICLTAIPQTLALARSRIDTGRDCSLTVRVSSDNADIDSVQIPVSLYYVADVDENGDYTLAGDFADSSVALPEAGSETTQEQWQTFTDSAANVAAEQGTDASRTFAIANGSHREEQLGCGLYLIVAQTVETAAHVYSFAPALIALPNNTFYTDGDDSWKYDVDNVMLKTECTPRYGSVSITKTLKTYNASLGKPLFVFDVEAVLDGETVYSNVVSIGFDDAGVQTAVIDGLPAGAAVTVTEVYAGACYTPETEQSVTVNVAADETTDAAFVNDYDDTLTYGTGVVNRFSYDGSGYTWEQLESSAQ